MTPFQRWVAAWLLTSDTHVFRLGDPDPAPMQGAVLALQNAGYTVLSPGEMPPVSRPLACQILLDDGCTILDRGELPPVSVDRASQIVREAGNTIYPSGVSIAIGKLGARDMLEREGYAVLAPGVEPPVSLERAAAVLKAADYTVMPPRQPPAIGCWAPEDCDLPHRWVLSISGDTMNYSQGSQTHSCAIGSFWKWRSKVRAVHVPAAPEPVLPPIPEDAA